MKEIKGKRVKYILKIRKWKRQRKVDQIRSCRSRGKEEKDDDEGEEINGDEESENVDKKIVETPEKKRKEKKTKKQQKQKKKEKKTMQIKKMGLRKKKKCSDDRGHAREGAKRSAKESKGFFRIMRQRLQHDRLSGR